MSFSHHDFCPRTKSVTKFFPRRAVCGSSRTTQEPRERARRRSVGEGRRGRATSEAQESSLSLSFSGAKLNVLEALRDEREVGRRACAVDKRALLSPLSVLRSRAARRIFAVLLDRVTTRKKNDERNLTETVVEIDGDAVLNHTFMRGV